MDRAEGQTYSPGENIRNHKIALCRRGQLRRRNLLRGRPLSFPARAMRHNEFEVVPKCDNFRGSPPVVSSSRCGNAFAAIANI